MGRVKLPYASRNPRAFEEIVEALVRYGGDCGYYSLVCEYEDARLEFVERRVRDRLSGLQLTLRVPVLVFIGRDGRVCRVEARWRGDLFEVDCRLLEKCCRRV